MSPRIDRDSRSLIDRTGLTALAAVFLVGVTLISLLPAWRLDLTGNQLYTLSEGTRKIVGNIPEPLNIYLFFSDQATADVPQLRTYAGRVREILAEFAGRSNGKLKLTVIDPQPFSDEEDRATGFGLRPINLGNAGDPIYFGIAATNSSATARASLGICGTIMTWGAPRASRKGVLDGRRPAGCHRAIGNRTVAGRIHDACGKKMERVRAPT